MSPWHTTPMKAVALGWVGIRLKHGEVTMGIRRHIDLRFLLAMAFGGFVGLCEAFGGGPF